MANMTLHELAIKYKRKEDDPKLRYFTAGKPYSGICVRGWTVKPTFYPGLNDWNFDDVHGGSITAFHSLNHLLDLSEYKDSSGNIDFSKCIVEVREMTFNKVAKILAKMFHARFITVHLQFNEIYICGFKDKPYYNCETWLWNTPYIFHLELSKSVLLDFSEYVKENGAIDFSKCIVEVADEN